MSNPPTGYTEYGSLGQYWITGSFPVVSSGPDLAVTSTHAGSFLPGKTDNYLYHQRHERGRAANRRQRERGRRVAGRFDRHVHDRRRLDHRFRTI